MRLSAFFWALAVAAWPVSGQFVQIGWTAFGDSFSAGPGAGADVPGSGSCRRREGAFPEQLNKAPALSTNPDHDFDFLACSGARTADVLPKTSSDGQIDKFRTNVNNNRDFATISIGGNDVGFSDTLDACVFHAQLSDCQVQQTNTNLAIEGIQPKLEFVYESLLTAARIAGAPSRFVLFVVGYPEFFNPDTEWCNTHHFGFWPITTDPPYLTQTLRNQLNGLVRKLNTKIQAAVNNVISRSTFGDVRFLETTPVFNGHRFCEEGVQEPDKNNPNTWFFLMTGNDADANGNLGGQPDVGPPVDLQPSECDAILNQDRPVAFGDDWGKYLICAVKKGVGQGQPVASWLNGTGDDFSGSVGLPESWTKAFHPKSVGHRAIMRAIAQNLQDEGPRLSRILIMHQGTQDQFNSLVARLPTAPATADPPVIYQRDGIDLRGYSTFLTRSQARYYRDNYPGVLGVCFENHLLGTPSLDDGAGDGNTKRLKTRHEHETAAAMLNLGRRQVTQTALDLQSPAGWHLRDLSNPPKFQDRSYLEYPGFLHDPHGGSTVNIYILGTGVYVDHPEFNGRIQTSFLTDDQNPAAGMRDDKGHETKVASVAAGAQCGVAKEGLNLIPVRWESSVDGETKRATSLFDSLLWILHHVRTSGKQGKSVINYSGGVGISQWGDPDWGELLTDDDVWVKADPWNAFLPLFRESDVVVVCSAGNDREPDQGSDGLNPRRNAKPGRQGETSLIVVGGTNQDGLIWDEGAGGPGTNKFYSIITAYAPAARMEVATIPNHRSNPNGGAQYGTDWGTSLSSGIVAGLIATFLDRPDLAGRFRQGSVASDMKTFLRDVVAPYHTDVKPNAMLRVGTFNYVPCPEDGDNGLVRRVGVPIRVPPNPAITANGVCTGLRPKQNVEHWTYLNCYQNVGFMGWADGPFVVSTLEECARECGPNSRRSYFGIVRANQCYCWILAPVPLIQVERRQCSSVCTGDATEICGGPAAFSIYELSSVDLGPSIVQVDGWSYEGCYVDSSTRLLPGASYTAADMSPAKCGSLCFSGGWTRFGIENANECWCSNAALDAAALASDPSTCDMPCSGDTTVLCGGGWRLTAYSRKAPVQPIAPVDGWTYSNCYVDGDTRSLPDRQPDDAAMTPAKCAALCTGRKVFGIEYGAECYCGDTISNSLIAPDPTSCNVACGGQPNFVCGGGWRLTVYTRNPPVVQQVDGWQAVGCVSDSTTRTLTGAAFMNQGDLTPAKCAALCSGSKYFGVEAGNECYCGHTLPSGLTAAATDCDAPCTGNDHYACGGGWRLNVYQVLQSATTSTTTASSTTRTSTTSTTTFTTSTTTSTSITTAFTTSTTDRRPSSTTTTSSSSSAPAVVCDAIPPSCDLATCQGTVLPNSNNQATCKTPSKLNCPCQPTASTPGFSCGAAQSCSLNGCNPQWSNNNQAVCTGGPLPGCTCSPTPELCGQQQPCDQGGCAGDWDGSGVKGVCKGNYAGCACTPAPGMCGGQQGCDQGGCDGWWDGTGVKGVCRGNYAGCACTPTAGMCGQQQSCDAGGCDGWWDGTGVKGVCRGNYAGCACTPTPGMCGQQQNCDAGGCDGWWDGSGVKGVCRGNYAGCGCTPTPAMCGQQQSCDDGGCNGGWNNGVAVCQGNYAGCRCYPTAKTCGQMASCDDGGCQGSFDYMSNTARCRANYVTCPCWPTGNTCGQRKGCEEGNCQGSINDAQTRASTCKSSYAGCPCNPSSSTPLHCGTLQSCSFADCHGYRSSDTNPIGICTGGPHQGCGCILNNDNPRPPPAGTWFPPPQPPSDPPLIWKEICWSSPPANQCLCFVSRENQLDPIAILPDSDCWGR